MENPLKNLSPFQRKLRVTLHRAEESILGKRTATGTMEQKYLAYVLRHNYHEMTFEEYKAYFESDPMKRKYHGIGCKQDKVNSIFFD